VNARKKGQKLTQRQRSGKNGKAENSQGLDDEQKARLREIGLLDQKPLFRQSGACCEDFESGMGSGVVPANFSPET